MSAVATDLEPMLTTSKVAHILECSPQAVVRWIQKGSLLTEGTRLYLEAIATPGGWRVKRSALDAYLARLTADRTGKSATVPSASRQSARVERLDAELVGAGFQVTK
jgi:Helix-turn-helix domain